MRTFSYSSSPSGLLDDRLLSLVASIHEHKGRQDLFIEAKADSLEALCEIAKIQSTGASNRIEGICTADDRLAQLVNEKVAPHNRDEQEIAGYRDVLSLIHESYDTIPLNPSVILQLHKMLYRYSGYTFGGHWKDTDNAIAEIDQQGNATIRFQPLPAIVAPEAVERICGAYNAALSEQAIDPLILIAMFVFDFVCIHPFNDGNGRMSRLLTLLLLYKSGYIVGRYISLEHQIEQSKNTYYEALQQSSVGWAEGSNDYRPFVSYLLGCIQLSYREFEDRVDGITINKASKARRVEMAIQRHPGPISRAEIHGLCPDVSDITIKRSLSALVKEGKIEMLGAGKKTAYRWVEA